MKKILLIVLFTFGLIACGDGDLVKIDANASSASVAITAAKAENKKAKALSFEWTTTGKLIKKAEKAAKVGKYAEAVKLANRAKRQALNAQKQAELAKKAGPLF